jgi:hypothetical protein
MSAEQGASTSTRTKRAGLFDVRIIIGALLGIYGVVLLVTGLVGTDDPAKSDSINVWTGAGLVVASAVFFVWARLRPVVVPMDQPAGEDDTAGPPPH